MVDAIVVSHDEAECFERTIDAVYVEVFGLDVGAANVQHLEDAYFGDDVDKAGVEMASEAGFVSVLLPVVFGGYLEEFGLQLCEIVTWCVLGEAVFVEDSLGAGDVRQEAADGEAVDADGGLFGADDVRQVEAVGLVEGGAEQGAGDFEAHVLEVARGREALFAELVDVEGEFGLDVLVWAFGVVDYGAVSLGELGELDGDGVVDGVAVADVVADVVGEGADGEGEVVGSLRVAEKADDEVAGADVVGEIGEKGVAEGIVAEVLNGRATVGIGVGLIDLRVGEVGEVLKDDGENRVFPSEVDDLFVGLDGVGGALGGDEEEKE